MPIFGGHPEHLKSKYQSKALQTLSKVALSYKKKEGKNIIKCIAGMVEIPYRKNCHLLMI